MARLLSIFEKTVEIKVIHDISNDPVADQQAGKKLKCDNKNQRITFVRHGERVDFTFGLNWYKSCIDSTGQYHQRDLNMPKSIPKRSNANDWSIDTPLTNMGYYQAVLVGQAMKDAGMRFSHVYSSPAFRSMKTCDGILEGMGLKDQLPIRVEPGMYEWLGFYRAINGTNERVIPNFLTVREFEEAGLNIDKNYVPVKSYKALEENIDETIVGHYDRHFDIMQDILKNNPTGDILIACHGGSMETCTRQLLGNEPRQHSEFIRVAKNIPYCAVGILCKDENDKWKFEAPAPFFPITHSSNSRFNYEHFVEMSKI